MYTNGLKDRFGSPLLSKKDADALYFDKKGYDWSPDFSAGVEFDCTPTITYTAPCNGWIIVYQKITTADGIPAISVNDVQILSLLNMSESEDMMTITGELSGQFLVGKNDVIRGGVVGQKAKFYPCKAETAEE